MDISQCSVSVKNSKIRSPLQYICCNDFLKIRKSILEETVGQCGRSATTNTLHTLSLAGHSQVTGSDAGHSHGGGSEAGQSQGGCSGHSQSSGSHSHGSGVGQMQGSGSRMQGGGSHMQGVLACKILMYCSNFLHQL